MTYSLGGHFGQKLWIFYNSIFMGQMSILGPHTLEQNETAKKSATFHRLNGAKQIFLVSSTWPSQESEKKRPILLVCNVVQCAKEGP